MFVKAKLETLVANIFTLYDSEQKGYISEDEFTYMVLNYPFKSLKGSLPHNFIIKRKPGESKNRSTTQPLNCFTFGTINSMSTLEPVESPKRRASQIESTCEIFAEEPKPSLGKRKKAVPTTINTRIMEWAVNEYEKNSSHGMMTLSDFQVWAKTHHDFFINFRQFFRPNLWLEYEEPTTRLKRLSFNKCQTQIKSSGKYGLIGSSMRDCRMAIFDNILMIFSTDHTEMPIRLTIMKELDVECFDEEGKMHLSHHSTHFPHFALIFNDMDHYKYWKVLVQNFSKRSIRLFYTTSKRLGSGAYSTVFLGTSVSDPRQKYAIKRINKSTLKDEHKEALAYSHQKRDQRHDCPEQQSIHNQNQGGIRRFRKYLLRHGTCHGDQPPHLRYTK